MMGETIGAERAHELGLVSEVMPADRLLARAQEIAAGLLAKPTLLLRYTRLLFTADLRKRLNELLGYGLALESLALMERPEK
jgi:enoyl-CoA hydratase/carnithine racemase